MILRCSDAQALDLGVSFGVHSSDRIANPRMSRQNGASQQNCIPTGRIVCSAESNSYDVTQQKGRFLLHLSWELIKESVQPQTCEVLKLPHHGTGSRQTTMVPKTFTVAPETLVPY